MKTPLYNKQGVQVGEVDLPKEVFEVPLSRDLVYQVARAQAANRRQVSAHTKTRAEVSGGGKKPWRQKHTGRARHGSIRSPIWVGGGIAGGPRKDRNFDQKINKKMRRKALAMVLSEKVRQQMLIVLEDLSLTAPKTKEMAAVLKSLPSAKKKGMIITPKYDASVIRASKNLVFYTTSTATNLNVLDALSVPYLIMPKDSIQVIADLLTKEVNA